MKKYTRNDYKKVCAILGRVSDKVAFHHFNNYFLHVMEQNPRFQELFESSNAADIPDQEVATVVQQYLDGLKKLESKTKLVAPWLDADPVALFQHVALTEKMFTTFESLPDEQFKAVVQAVAEKKLPPSEGLTSIGITDEDIKDYKASLIDDFKLED